MFRGINGGSYAFETFGLSTGRGAAAGAGAGVDA